MRQDHLVLRTYVLIDKMEPQYASLTGTVIKGDICVPGDAELYIELSPGSEVFPMVDIALKAADVRPGFQIVEREYGEIELHAHSVETVRTAGDAILAAYGLTLEERIQPVIVSHKLISKVNPYQAQLINRTRRGNILLPGEALFILEVEPAGYVVLATNEAERRAQVKIVDFDPVGRYGRLYLSGKPTEVQIGMKSALEALGSIRGKSL